MNEFVGKKVDVYDWQEVKPGVTKKVALRGIVISQKGIGRQSLLTVKMDSGGLMCVSGWVVMVVDE